MTKDAQYWAEWFWGPFFTEWLGRVQDDHGGVFDTLDADANPELGANKSLLAQTRTLFTFAHAGLATGDPVFVKAAQRQLSFLQHFQKAPGLYRCITKRDGSPTGAAQDEYARSYDHSFVILGLTTLNKLSPSPEIGMLIDQCWTALTEKLTDPATGLLRNDDSGVVTDPAQNPHMHLYEACLQAFRMTDNAIWLTRATHLRKTGLRYFLDPDSGTITEFLTPTLEPLPGAAGHRREVGHQCEWAWLLEEEAALANIPEPLETAKLLFGFTAKHGFDKDGLFKGAVFDAVSDTGNVVENSYLLWPQTEAIKILAIRHTAGQADARDHGRALMCLMFERWFEDRTCFVNQFDQDGKCIWPQGLTRLMYHLVIAMTEGAKAGLWPKIPRTP